MAVESLPSGSTLLAVLGLVVALAIVLRGLGVLLRIAVHLFAFPGVVVHEFAHATACRLVGVRVIEAVYFRFGNPPGYVRHATPDRYRQSVVISVAPFLLNTVAAVAAFVGAVLVVAAAGGVRTAPLEYAIASGVLGWIGLSIGMAAFPSTTDARTLWTRSRREWRRSPVVLLGLPIVALIYVVNVLSWLWAHVLYAVGLFVLALVTVGALAI
ncbi:DUF3267 domain-containing protein [Natronococcus occultus]|uniref:DUF3267 domain-containing protein n=1 Tax=Natronococcus occultus SP4 TaxID=694430 RepID=L0JYR8_9EURY|nr:DUF3267 domain-containing protein [Natronococcus occultus]AGB38192.1 hypothetical protein Natoc_2417 [Natronococcus occultus SP4]